MGALGSHYISLIYVIKNLNNFYCFIADKLNFTR